MALPLDVEAQKAVEMPAEDSFSLHENAMRLTFQACWRLCLLRVAALHHTH